MARFYVISVIISPTFLVGVPANAFKVQSNIKDQNSQWPTPKKMKSKVVGRVGM